MASKQTQKTQQQQQQSQQSQQQLAKQKAAEEAEKIKEYIAKQVLRSAPINVQRSRVLLILFSTIVSIIPIVIPMTSMNIVTSSCQSPCSK
jgi:2,3-bisphosphoglycerate-independent phosphoglycerate mutase